MTIHHSMEDFVNPKGKESCLSCKIISISCLSGIGGYLIHTAKLYKGKARIFTTILGTGAVCLAIGEIFNKSPFRK